MHVCSQVLSFVSDKGPHQLMKVRNLGWWSAKGVAPSPQHSANHLVGGLGWLGYLWLELETCHQKVDLLLLGCWWQTLSLAKHSVQVRSWHLVTACCQEQHLAMAMLAWMVCLLVMGRSAGLRLKVLESLVMLLVTAQCLSLLPLLGSGRKLSGSNRQRGSPC